MRSSSRLMPPSPLLIRYLYIQSQTFPQGGIFFTRNPALRSVDFSDRCPRAAAWGLAVLRPAPKDQKSSQSRGFPGQATSRRLSTTAVRRAKVGPLPIEARERQTRWASTSAVATPPPITPGTAKSKEGNPWLEALLGRRKKKSEVEVEDGSMFNLSRSRVGKAAGNELKLRCTEFDDNGKVTLVNGEFKKTELIAKYGLLPRDLRKIDSSLLPNVLVRPSAILINLLHLRVLIKYNRVLVFDAYGSTDSHTQSLFIYDLEGKLAQQEAASKLPYELRALEAVLVSVCSALESEFDTVREPVVRVLRELEEDIDRDKLRYLLVYSKKLGTFEQKAKLVRNAIDELLDADDDLAAMYLTEKAAGKTRGESDHTEVEMLLESYHKVCDEIVQASGNLVSNIRNTEEIVKAILDANRNALMLLDLKFSIGTLGIGSGAFIAALFGMNLKNFMEEATLGFGSVSVASAVLAGVVIVYGLSRLRRVQRISMWGQRGAGGQGAAAAAAAARRHHLLEERGGWKARELLGREERNAGLGLGRRGLESPHQIPDPPPALKPPTPVTEDTRVVSH
ncbi:MAG: magnesium ion transporter [Vezdaea aestivalis]|nr:MAG: magnesium ion transporter [Vezdaea aestivalis]